MPKWDDERDDDTDLYSIVGLPDTPAVAALRERLSQYNWASVEHCYGSAEDLPRMLLALLSTDMQEVGRGLHGLSISACHQGSLYEASAPVATFLIEILPLADPGLWPYLLGLQAGLAGSDWRIARHWVSLRYNFVTRQHERRSTEELLRTGDRYSKPEWIREAHNAAAAGCDTYLAILQQAEADDDETGEERDEEDKTEDETGDSEEEGPDTIAMALYLLAGLPEHAARIIPIAERIFETSQDLTRQATALMTLSALLEDNAPGWDRFVALLAAPPTETPPLLRFVAALSLARDQPGLANDAVIETLVEELVGTGPTRSEVATAYWRLPWTGFGSYPEPSDELQALGQLGAPMGLRGLLSATQRKAASGGVGSGLSFAEAALDVAFFGSIVTHREGSFDAQSPGADALNGQASKGSAEAGQKPPETYTYHGYDKGAARALADRFAREGAAALTDPQREALTTLLACDPLWAFPHNLMAIYGLPATRASVAHFLATQSAEA